MAFDPIHSLSFDWTASAPSSLTYDQYTIDIIVNEEFRERITQNYDEHTLTVENLLDGDYVYLEVIPTDGEALLLNDVITTSLQYVPITNFHNTNDKKIEYNGININGVTQSFLKQEDGSYYFSGQYIEQSIDINLSAINPRDNEILVPGEEPFYSGISYEVSCTTGVVASGFQESLDFLFYNNYEQRDLGFKFVLEDVYNSGTTGLINLSKPIPSVTSETSSFNTGYNSYASSGVITFNLAYSNKVNFFDYTFYNDTNYTGILSSGRSYNIYSSTGLFPINQTGYLEIVPHDWFGTGQPYYRSNPIITFTEVEIPVNTFNSFSGYNEQTGINFVFSIEENNSEGSFIEYSISPNVAHFHNGCNSTGSIHGGLTGRKFNVYDLRDKGQDNFYYRFDLIRSGTNVIEDQRSGLMVCTSPAFTSSGISFDYNLGLTKFSTEHNHESLGLVDAYYSGNGDTSFNLYSSEVEVYGEKNPSFRFELRDKNTQVVLDEGDISATANRPSLFLGDITFPSLEASTNCVIKRSTDPVKSVTVYKKPTFEYVSGNGVPAAYKNNQAFNDYLSFEYEDGIPIGHYIDRAPEGSPARDTEYIDSVNNIAYLSGLKYVYRFMPLDGYGTGYISDPKLLSFAPNPIAKSSDTELVQTENRVTSTETRVSSTESSIQSIQESSVGITGAQYIGGNKVFTEANDFKDNITVSGNLDISGALYVSGRRLDPSNLVANSGSPNVSGVTLFPSNIFFGNSAGVFYSEDTGTEQLSTLDAVLGSYVMPTSGYIGSLSVSAIVETNDSERYYVRLLKNGVETTGVAKSDIVSTDYTEVAFYENMYIPFAAGDQISAEAYNGESDNMEVYETTVMARIYTP